MKVHGHTLVAISPGVEISHGACRTLPHRASVAPLTDCDPAHCPTLGQVLSHDEWIAREFPPTASGLHADVRERFLVRVSVPEGGTGCWTWLRHDGRESAAYGLFSIGGRVVGAHRVAHELATGEPIPAGLWGLHRCGRGAEGCVRPSHIYAGTPKQNAEDANRHAATVRGMPAGRVRRRRAA